MVSVLEMCDTDSSRFEQIAREASFWSPWRWIAGIEKTRSAKNEGSEIGRFDMVTLHTEQDARRLGFRPDQLLISTQGVDLRKYPYTPIAHRNGNCIAVIGRVDFFPNLKSIEWFAENVIPRLPKHISLKVIGECSAAVRAKLEKYDRVSVTGRVQSMSEACADCFAAVAPMAIASGIQNKVLEYFAMGLPTIMTEVVSRGLLKSASGAYLVAESAEDWAEKLVAIHQHRESFAHMTAHAREYIESTHSWGSIGDQYIAKVMGILRQERPGDVDTEIPMRRMS